MKDRTKKVTIAKGLSAGLLLLALIPLDSLALRSIDNGQGSSSQARTRICPSVYTNSFLTISCQNKTLGIKAKDSCSNYYMRAAGGVYVQCVDVESQSNNKYTQQIRKCAMGKPCVRTSKSNSSAGQQF